RRCDLGLCDRRLAAVAWADLAVPQHGRDRRTVDAWTGRLSASCARRHRALTQPHLRNEAMSGEQAGGLTYAEAGVDIDAGNAMVEAIKPLVRATRRPGADAEIGGFGGLFDLKAAGFS